MKREKTDFKPRLRELPHKPGIYIFKDRLGRIIYVGKAKDLYKRVSQYFHSSRMRRADLKTRALVESIWDFEIHTVKSEAESILLEGKLIKQYRPKYNISFRDDKRFLLLKINLNEPLPRFVLTRIKKDDGAKYYGPFADATALRHTLHFITRKFHVRSCKPTIPALYDFKHCLEHIIKHCSAPCIQKITYEAYRKQVELACDFLEGKLPQMADQLEVEMQKAAEKLNFEKAAQLRNMLDDIKATLRPQKRFLRDFPTGIIPEKDLEELRDTLHLQAAPAVIECFDISNISTTHKVASMVCFKNGRAANPLYRRYRIKTVEGQDDFASMGEVIRRRYARLKNESSKMPDLIVVDGGKGQVSAALKELEALGFLQQPLIGLAKENEEIFLPRNPYPMILPRESGAIRLLQRVRDEAHRFANTYHQLLMKKRVAESVLDECPGVSRNKKMSLLRHFGSIEKIRKASLEELTEVKGISVKLAEIIIKFFERKN